MAVDEQDVAGEDRPVRGHIGQRVAAGMRRADLDQLDGLGAHLPGRAAAEGGVRQPGFDAG